VPPPVSAGRSLRGPGVIAMYSAGIGRYRSIIQRDLFGLPDPGRVSHYWAIAFAGGL